MQGSLQAHRPPRRGNDQFLLKTDLRNERSQRAIERIGGVREGVLRKHLLRWDGFIRDTVYYSILASEWPDVKRRLENLLRTPGTV